MKGKSKKVNKWGERLGASLAEKKVGLRQAAKIAGVSSSVLHSWVHGRNPTDLLAVKRLCDELDFDFTWILTGQFSKGREAPSLAEIYEEQPYFDGLARIRIDRLIPRKSGKSGSDESEK